MQTTAAAAYAATTDTIARPRDIELRLFERAISYLNGATESGDFPKRAQAVHFNNRLWTALMSDLANDDNGLPDALKAQLISLGGFSLRHGDAVLNEGAAVLPLVEVNRAMMAGLKAGGSV